ncbi:MAG: maturation protein [Sanya fiers-like virus 46]|nr:MAG: maturation protein [Sanya fiers-like virus 46]
MAAFPLGGAMSIKSYVRDRSQVYSGYSNSWQCSGGSPTLVASSPTTTTIVINRRSLSIDTVLTNNRRARPWTTLSYRKVELWGNPWTIDFYTDVTCWVWNGWTNVPVTSKFMPLSRGFIAGFSANQGTGWESADYTPDLAECDSIALSKLLNALKDARSQYSLAVALGEGKETAAHLASTARRLVNGFRAFRKGNIGDAYKHLAGRRPVPVRKQRIHRGLKKKARDGSLLDDVSSGWMEFSYAWMPLLSDIDSAARYIAEKCVDPAKAPVQRFSKKHTMEKDQTKLVSYNSWPNEYKARFVCKTTTTVRYTYELAPAYQPRLLEELGFTDPATVAWNLLPLSFVVDWFVNVGQVLESLHEFQQWRVVRGIKATKVTNMLEKTLYSGPVSNNCVISAPPQGATFARYSREPQSSLPTAIPLRVTIDNPFDLKSGQMASAAVLLRYAFLQPTPRKG